jgi:CRP-like cAMP-binding protein
LVKSGSPRPPPDRSRNKLLAALPQADYRRMLPLLTTVPLKFKQVLHKQGAKIDTIYFPCSGVCSIVNVLKDRRIVEMATVGNEGVVGITVFLGGDIAAAEAFVQVAGDEAQAMSADAFREEIERHGPLFDLISRYSQALQALIMQSVACNALHSVEQRCCRWLLMTQDRVDSHELYLTHEFLAYMLGVSRPTVTLVLGVLNKAGVVSNGTKKITVLNRKKLEGTSCECYQTVQNTFVRLLPNAH